MTWTRLDRDNWDDGARAWIVPALRHPAITVAAVKDGNKLLSSAQWSWRNPSEKVRWLDKSDPPERLVADLEVQQSAALVHLSLTRRKAAIHHGLFVASVSLGVALTAVAVVLVIIQFRQGESLSFRTWLALVVGAAGLCSAPTFKSRFRDWQRRQDDAEFEVDIDRLDRAPTEAKADRLWRMNQRQLIRYHEANLQHSAWALVVGVGCVAAGIAIACSTMFLLLEVENEAVQRLVAGVGGIGTVLTSFVGAIALRMQASSAANLDSFHHKLVHAQRLALANVIAAQVEDDARREETYSKIANAIVGDSLEEGR